MAFERNDIVNKTRLAGELGEELMGFEHNDIVTVDVMNKAIEEGGGGGEIPAATVTFINSASGYVYYIYPVNLVDGVITQSEVRVETSVDLQMPLGENGTFIPLGENIDSDTAPVLTGDIEAILDEGDLIGFKVTGDGTITLKGTGAE